ESRGGSMRRRHGAPAVKGGNEVLGDFCRLAAFYVAAFHHERQLAFAHQGDARRRWRISGEIAAGLASGFVVLSGKHADDGGWNGDMTQRQAHRGTHAAGGTAAD